VDNVSKLLDDNTMSGNSFDEVPEIKTRGNLFVSACKSLESAESLLVRPPNPSAKSPGK